MKSMKFLSLSLLLVSFCGSALAMDALLVDDDGSDAEVTRDLFGIEQKGGSTKKGTWKTSLARHDAPHADSTKKSAAGGVSEQENESTFDNLVARVAEARTSTKLGVVGLLAVGAFGTAYKFHPGFKTAVNNLATKAKEKFDEVKPANKKKALVAGGTLCVASLLAGLYVKKDAISAWGNKVPKARASRSNLD